MGTWSETCAISFMPITYGEPCVLLYIAENDIPEKSKGARHCDSSCRDVLSFPFYGKYTGYGTLDDFESLSGFQKECFDNLIKLCKIDDDLQPEDDYNSFHERAERGDVIYLSKNFLRLKEDNVVEHYIGESVLVPLLIKRSVWDYIINIQYNLPAYAGGKVKIESIIDSGMECVTLGSPFHGEFNDPVPITSFFNLADTFRDKKLARSNLFYEYLESVCFDIGNLFRKTIKHNQGTILTHINNKNTDIVRPISEIYMLNIFLRANRRILTRTIGAGSQDEYYDGAISFYSKMLKIAKADKKTSEEY